MRQERGPRLDMEPVDESGKGVGEEESGRRTASVGALMIKIPHLCDHHLHPWRAPIADFSCVGRGSGIVKVLRNLLGPVASAGGLKRLLRQTDLAPK